MLSTRISKKRKAIVTPEDEKPKKRKKDAEEKSESGEGKADIPEAEVDVSTVEGRVFTDVEMKQADNVVDKAKKVSEGAAEQGFVGISKEVVEEETVEPVVKKDVLEEASIQDASVLLTGKEDKNGEQVEKKTGTEDDKSKEHQKVW